MDTIHELEIKWIGFILILTFWTETQNITNIVVEQLFHVKNMYIFLAIITNTPNLLRYQELWNFSSDGAGEKKNCYRTLERYIFILFQTLDSWPVCFNIRIDPFFDTGETKDFQSILSHVTKFCIPPYILFLMLQYHILNILVYM